MEKDDFPATALLLWFARACRDLPWRRTYDPYAVWVSEVMLQQTRVDQMLPFFDRFMARFPVVQALADAPEQEVLKCWEGLGYYSRARNLHAAAKRVVERFDGRLPSDYAQLLGLPGFGPYISAAVASIAFNADHAVLDGNVYRVLARFFGITDDVRSPKSRKRFQSVADLILPSGKARDFNQALMELGALVCTPDAPLCAQCPLRERCFAFAHNRQAVLPVSSKKPARPVKTFAALRVSRGDSVWLVAHESRLLHGLYSFPLVEFDPLRDDARSIARKAKERFGVDLGVGSEKGRVTHDYTHFRQIAVLFDCHETGSNDPAAFFSLAEMRALPLSKLQHKLAVL
jgi:A/G-specific adenine glycosylase